MLGESNHGAVVGAYSIGTRQYMKSGINLKDVCQDG